jgi:hypothetical protein
LSYLKQKVRFSKKLASYFVEEEEDDSHGHAEDPLTLPEKEEPSVQLAEEFR